MNELSIALIQLDLKWEDKEYNLDKITNILKQTSSKIDIAILPEMFTTAFSMNVTELAEGMDGPSIKWMLDSSNRFKCAILGSIIVRENNNFYNRFLFVTPDGVLNYYNKRHLFRLGEEDQYYDKGNDRKIIEYKNWKICPLICYDLRFPIWSRNNNEYDFLIYVANWPDKRSDHWKKLLYARAIENQCYVAGVNRIGVDGRGYVYSGDSLLIGPSGNLIGSIEESIEGVITNSINKEELIRYREKLPFYLDNDRFEIK